MSLQFAARAQNGRIVDVLLQCDVNYAIERSELQIMEKKPKQNCSQQIYVHVVKRYAIKFN